jgi:aconitate hydratase
VTDSFEFAKSSIDSYKGKATYFDITRLKEIGCDLDGIPYSIRVLLENTLRHAGVVSGAIEAVRLLADWPNSVGKELPFMPIRVLL